MKQKVLNVGQCALDHSNISELLKTNFDVEIDRANSHDEAVSLAHKNQYSLILVNRIYDADGSWGQNTIEKLCAGGEATPVMLISNYPDAQESAVEAGASPGFGKAQLGDAATVDKLKAHLA